MVGIPGLPKTAQDAISSARKLNLRYLWVDSLCIIQDSEEDKEKEMARMDKIYENATVTIVAASAPTCHDGFLNVRKKWTDADGPSIRLPYSVRMVLLVYCTCACIRMKQLRLHFAIPSIPVGVRPLASPSELWYIKTYLGVPVSES
jgi:hypothetical protein